MRNVDLVAIGAEFGPEDGLVDVGDHVGRLHEGEREAEPRHKVYGSFFAPVRWAVSSFSCAIEEIEGEGHAGEVFT